MAAQIDKSTLVDLLTAGHSQSQVAEMLKVTPGAITQALDSSPELRAALEQAKLAAAGAEMDNAYDALERMALQKLKHQMALLQDPLKTARILKTVNEARRRTGLLKTAQAPTGAPVTLVLPVLVQQKIQMNAERQVIEVEGRQMITMPAKNVMDLLSAQKEKEALPLREQI